MGRNKNRGVCSVPMLAFNAFSATRVAELLLLSSGVILTHQRVFHSVQDALAASF